MIIKQLHVGAVHIEISAVHMHSHIKNHKILCTRISHQCSNGTNNWPPPTVQEQELRSVYYSSSKVQWSGVPEWPTCMIASRDYCHAPLGVSSFSFSIQNVWEMTTVVDKIACRSCTACPPPMVLRLFIADTIGFTTVYS